MTSTGAGAEEPKSKGPSFVGKPRIIPKDGGALIVMECKVKSPTPPVAKAVDPHPRSARTRRPHVPLLEAAVHGLEVPKKAMKSREGTPKRGLKEKEGSPAKKSMRFASIPSMASYRVLALPFRSRTSTPVQESASTLGPEDAVSPGDSRRSSKNMSKMEVDSTTVKRKPEGLPVPPQADEKKMRTSSPVPPEPAMQEIPEKMEKTPTPPKSKSPTPPEPAKQQIPEKKEKTPTPPKSKSPAPSEPEKPQIPEKKDRSPAAPEPAKQIPEKKDRSPAPPSRQDQAKRDKFTRPPIVMEASKSKTGKPGDSLTLEVEWQCHTSTVIEWYK
ncbi:hypothetical protein ANCDUO_01416 [Ancylostoma duodenale]|uniref:Uncharacterized protein n=1 Tax=Ancylostoma duodenale TaxID=51022 RepID=A0A0C2DYX6_9BILA|nr:hypothetical protein ANCDUO_01416 [Ancylostoma duodenale]